MLVVWNSWLPSTTLACLVSFANERLTTVADPWRHVRGPALSMVASCARLAWANSDASTLITDKGRTLLLGGSPAVIKQEVGEAVQRWRWTRVELKIPRLQLRGIGVGGDMRPIWRALAAKRSEGWGSAERAAFRSVFTNRQ